MEITIESPDEHLRRVNGKFPCSNAEVEQSIGNALAQGCRKIDLFFMVGLPHQTPAQALSTVGYCERLVRLFGADPRLQFYVAPLGPFLDPGSRAFEDPALGYHRRFVTLDEHRRALEEIDWREVLSFDTDEMDRAALVETTYLVAEGLNALKHDAGLVDDATFSTVADHLARARAVIAALDGCAKAPLSEREAVLAAMHTAVAAANAGSVVGTNELRWTPSAGIRVSKALLGYLLGALGAEFGKSAARFRGRYDIAVTAHRSDRRAP